MNIVALEKKAAKIPFGGASAAYLAGSEERSKPVAFINHPQVTQEQADARDKTDSTLSEIIPAAFRESNLTAATWDWLDKKHTIDTGYDKEAGLATLTKDIPQEYHRDFTGLSLEEDTRILQDVKQRMQDSATLAAGGWTAVGAQGVAMLLDPVGIGLFGTESKLLSRVLTKGARAKNALFHGFASAGTGLVYEDALKTAHGSSMDAEDALYTGLGFFAGGSAIGAFSKGNALMHKELGAVAKKAQASMDAELLKSANVVHEPMTHAEAFARAGEELPDIHEVGEVLHAPYVEARAQEILRGNAKSIAEASKPKPVIPAVSPEELLTGKDSSLGMFAQARKNIQERWDAVVTNDGSTLGMFNVVGDGSPNKAAVNTSVERVATEEASAESVLAEHAVSEGASASLKYSERARQLEASGAWDTLNNSAVGKAQKSVGVASASDSSFVVGLNAPEARLFAHDLLENGTGTFKNAGNASRKKQVLETRLMSIAGPGFKDFERGWRQENGKTGFKNWLRGEWYADMEKELRVEMELRTNAHANGVPHESPFSLNTQRMADRLDMANGKEGALGAIQHYGVWLSDKIVERPGYVSLFWQGRKMQAAKAIKGLPEAYRAAYAESVVEVTGMPLKDARQISKQMWLRAEVNDLGIDANPHALLSKDNRVYFRQMLENNGNLSEAEINGMFARIDAQMADSGASARVKRRTGVDLLKTFEHEGKQYQLLDLVDNDVEALHRRYIGEMSGRAALASKEIGNEADWTAMRTAVLEGMGKAGDTPQNVAHMKKVMDGTYNQFLSRPVGGGVDRNARRLMDWTGISLLGAMGLPQIAETGQILGAHSIRTMYETFPQLRQFRKSIINGTVDGGLLADLMPYTGRLWDEMQLFRKRVRLEDKLGSDGPVLRHLDRLTASIQEFSGWASMMYSIKRFQQQWDVLLQTHKMGQALKSLELGADGSWKLTGKFKNQEERLSFLGWDTDFFTQMKGVEKHFEWDGDILQRMNMQKWNDPMLVDKFVEGIHTHTARVIQKPLIGESRVWMHSTLGAMLTQFRSYPLYGIEKQTMNGIHFKDSTSYFSAMYALGLSSMVSNAKAAVMAQGKSDEDRKKYLDSRMSTAGMFKGAMAYASPMSVLPELFNVVGAYVPGLSSLVSTQGSRMGGTRGINPSLKDIPSVGTAINAVNAAGGFVRNTLDPSYKLNKADIQARRSITPMGTMLGVSNLLNVMDEAARED